MSAQNYLAYTYVIGWKKEHKFYYGVRYANGCQISDLWTTYFTHSTKIPTMRKLYGEPDLIKIHRTFSNKDEAILFEEQMLRRLINKKQHIWLNRNISGAIIMTNEVRQKISKSLTGKKKARRTATHKKNLSKALEGRYGEKASFYGKTHSTETKKKISQSRKGKCVGKDNPNYGKKFSAEHRKKLSESHKGQKPSENQIKASSKMVEYNGIIYTSRRKAAEELGVSESTIYHWIKIGKAKSIIQK